MDAAHATPCDALPPFQVICPTCGRHSDAEDTEFRLVVALPFPGSECLLAGLTCMACGTRLDRALWPVDPEPLEAIFQKAGGALEPETVALRARYDRAVADYRTQWERLYAERRGGPFGQHGVDLSEVTVVPSLAPKTVVDMRVLAAAQVCREVALRYPGQDPAGMLVGPYRCALSLDPSPDAHHRGVLHLSVSHALGLGRLQRIEEAFLTGLYFTADERPRLAEEYGRTVPCTHVRYPLLASP